MEFLYPAAGHFLGDVAFQPADLAKEKGESWEANGYHALTYTSSVFLAGKIGGFEMSLTALALILISHFLIDPIKARWKIIKADWMDQTTHLVILYGIVILKI